MPSIASQPWSAFSRTWTGLSKPSSTRSQSRHRLRACPNPDKDVGRRQRAGWPRFDQRDPPIWVWPPEFIEVAGRVIRSRLSRQLCRHLNRFIRITPQCLLHRTVPIYADPVSARRCHDLDPESPPCHELNALGPDVDNRYSGTNLFERGGQRALRLSVHADTR